LGTRSDRDEAVERGVFGAPTFFVGEEMLWGNDRLHFVEAALKHEHAFPKSFPKELRRKILAENARNFFDF
jgi:hypothetical protein